MIRITDQIFVGTEYLACNVGVVLTEQGLILIDTPALPDDIRNLRNELKQLSRLDIAYLIYTHEHFDHLIGSTNFTRRIIAHQRTINEIVFLKTNLPKEVNRYFPDVYRQYKEAFDSVEIVLPQITFEGKLELNMGNRTLKLFYAGGHSEGSLAVYVPEDKVLFAGDNIVSGMPLVTPNSLFNEWIDFLYRVEMMDIDTIIPGHGMVCGKEAVIKTRIYFETTRDHVKSLIDAGASRDEVVKKIDLTDCLPVPPDETITQQTASTISAIYDQIQRE